MMKDHKQWVSDIFDRTAHEYGQKNNSYFTYFGKRLTEQVHIPSKAHILDVATGRGAVLFPLADAVGPSGKVVGIDISPQMIEETSREVIERNLPSIQLLCMDAERLDFPDHCFDFVFCGFALFFFPSVLAALSEFNRVLKPGGQLVVSTWGKDSELDTWLTENTPNVKGLSVTSVYSDTELHKVLVQASFKEIRIIEETKICFHPTPEEWWNSLWHHGVRAKFEQLSTTQLENLRKNALKKAFSMDNGKGIAEPFHVYYGIAKKS